MYCDSHSHIYLDAFDHDRKEAVARATKAGVKYILLPNIDSGSYPGLMETAKAFPGTCFPMAGLHPTSVKENFEEEILFFRNSVRNDKVFAIGETGIDLYWDKTFLDQQILSLRAHIEAAIETGLPLVLHSRKSLNEIFQVLKDYQNEKLTGVFHCFPGNLIEAERAVKLGFYLGIGGVVTYKNAGMAEVVKEIPLEHILLETDSPFLPPVPHRGERNESAYIPVIAENIARIRNMETNEVAKITTANAVKLFNLPS